MFYHIYDHDSVLVDLKKLNICYIYLKLNLLFEKIINKDDFVYDTYTEYNEPNKTNILILRSVYAFKLFNKKHNNLFNTSFQQLLFNESLNNISRIKNQDYNNQPEI